MRGYRYEHRPFAIGEMMLAPEVDSFLRLTPREQVVDRAIRDILPNGDDLRGSSIYIWEDYEWANRAWQLRGSPFLYELEFDASDILFRSDVNHYTDACDAMDDRKLFDEAIARYRENAPLLNHHLRPRVELLVARACVTSVITV